MKNLLASLALLLLAISGAKAAYASRADFDNSRVFKNAFTLDNTKRTVCTITLNSSDEKQVFKKFLDPNRFQFVELTPAKRVSGLDEDESQNTEHWFDQACATGVKCDVLVVSGHFGGSFFGDTGHTLSLNKLEAKSCANTCSGILSRPKEAYLFGCNTLASKDKDFRTPAEYIRVLMDDGWNATDAAMVAEARYGLLANENKVRMQTAFKGVPRVYGFDSIGPSGKNIRASLESYLRSIGDYGAYLDSLKPMSSAADAKTLSPLFMNALSRTSATVCRGSDPNAVNCDLLGENKTVGENLATIERYLNGSDRAKHAANISSFLEDNSQANIVVDRTGSERAKRKDFDGRARGICIQPWRYSGLRRLRPFDLVCLSVWMF